MTMMKTKIVGARMIDPNDSVAMNAKSNPFLSPKYMPPKGQEEAFAKKMAVLKSASAIIVENPSTDPLTEVMGTIRWGSATTQYATGILIGIGAIPGYSRGSLVLTSGSVCASIDTDPVNVSFTPWGTSLPLAVPGIAYYDPSTNGPGANYGILGLDVDVSKSAGGFANYPIIVFNIFEAQPVFGFGTQDGNNLLCSYGTVLQAQKTLGIVANAMFGSTFAGADFISGSGGPWIADMNVLAPPPPPFTKYGKIVGLNGMNYSNGSVEVILGPIFDAVFQDFLNSLGWQNPSPLNPPT